MAKNVIYGKNRGGGESLEIEKQIEELSPWYQALDFGNGIVTKGGTHPSKIFTLIEPFLPSKLDGLKVIDSGCNAGGVGVEFAKRGAQVIGIDAIASCINQAHFYKNTMAMDNIEFFKDSVFNLHKYASCDVLLVLGMVYHFRNPQLFLDYVCNIKATTYVISSQIRQGSNLVLYNREEFHRINKMQGWEATLPMFMMMLEDSGFTDIQHISPPVGEKGYTNNGYFICKSGAPRKIDVHQVGSMYGLVAPA